MNRFLLLAMLLITGCAQLPPPPEDAVAKRFENMPDRAVIYLARHALEPSYIAPVMLDDQMIGSTYRGTYMRIEIPAGTHVLRGLAGDSGGIRMSVEAGKIYYVQHRAYGYRTFVSSSFDPVGPEHGRSLVMGGQLTALINHL
jgi:hypothetical protein